MAVPVCRPLQQPDKQHAPALYLDTLNRLFSKYIYNNQPISMAVLYYRYESIKPDAIANNLLRSSNGQLFDVAGRTQSPYNTNEMFAVAPIRQAAVTGSNKIIFRPELFVGNTGKTVSALAIDVNATGTWQAVAMNTPVTINFTNEGFYNINIRITYTDGTQKLGHTKLAVYANTGGSTLSFTKPMKQRGSLCAVNNFRFSPLTFGDNPLFPQNISATKAYLGVLGTGDITIEYGRNNTTGQIRKPLIVIEGFDPTNDYNYQSFIRSSLNDINFNVASPITLNDNLDNVGDYDVIFLNLNNATDFIQRNAFLVEAVIQEVNRIKTVYNGVRQQNVIIGLSMGGVLTRYALRDMENSGIAHETRLFIAHDSPFKGANIPVAFQIAAQHLGPWKIINGAPNFPFIRYVDLVLEVANLLNAYNSPAAKQLLIQRYNLTPTGALTADNTTYNTFQNELNTLGWPANCRNITVSNGSCNGTKVFNNSNANFFQIVGDRNMTYFGALWRSLALSLGGVLTPTGIFTGPGNPQPNTFALLWEFPLTFLSTKTSLGLNFSCNAIPTTGTAEIYRGQVYSKKKIVGLFNVTSNFINLVTSSQSGMIPLDEAPGGKYDLEVFGVDPTIIQQQLPNFFQGFITSTINQSSFCFVPTVSSTAHNSAASAWFNPVCGTIECNTPSQVADFYLQNNNQLHISYTQANGDWIMQRQDAGFSCMKVCTSSLSITGSSTVCSPQTYTLSNLPVGATVTWSASPTGLVSFNPVGPTTNPSTQVSKLATGTTTLQAVIPSCNNQVAITKPVTVGAPAISNITAQRVGASCNYDAKVVFSGSGTIVEFSQDNSLWMPGTSSGSYFHSNDNFVGPSSQLVYARTSNACGTGPVTSKTLSIPAPPPGCYNQLTVKTGAAEEQGAPSRINQISVYPNPVTKKLIVQVPAPFGDAWVSLYSNDGKRVYKERVTRSVNVLNMAPFKAGLYLVEINSNGTVKTAKVIKE